MIITEDGYAAAALPSLRINEHARINLEMAMRLIGHIPCRAAGADPALTAKQDAADFLRRCPPGQLLQIGQHRA